MKKKKSENPYKFSQLKERQMYALIKSNRLYTACDDCRCVMCSHWRYECKTCAMCVREPHPFTRCKNFEPFIFSSEPYKSYVRELDNLKEERRFYLK